MVLICCVACVALIGIWQSAAVETAKWLTLVALVASSGWALADWYFTESGRLQWDGQQWLWSGFGDTPVQRLALALDFQSLVLVRLHAEGFAVRWLWLEGRRRNRQWLALRRAIVGTVGHK